MNEDHTTWWNGAEEKQDYIPVSNDDYSQLLPSAIRDADLLGLERTWCASFSLSC
jgi:hypothetical protein